MGRIAGLILLVCIALGLGGCGGGDGSSDAGSTSAGRAPTEDAGGELTEPEVEAPRGPPPTELISKDLVKGTGAVVKKGGDITIDYVAVDYETGKKVESSWDGEPYSGTLGRGNTIEGWKRGIPGMRVGGRRVLILPPNLAHGDEYVSDATMVYVIDLLAAHE